jgi:hypothetical protein
MYENELAMFRHLSVGAPPPAGIMSAAQSANGTLSGHHSGRPHHWSRNRRLLHDLGAVTTRPGRARRRQGRWRRHGIDQRLQCHHPVQFLDVGRGRSFLGVEVPMGGVGRGDACDAGAWHRHGTFYPPKRVDSEEFFDDPHGDLKLCTPPTGVCGRPVPRRCQPRGRRRTGAPASLTGDRSLPSAASARCGVWR